MRAAVLSPDLSHEAVSVQQWPDPEPREGWVVVRVVRTSLNRLDRMTVDERADLPQPAVIGSDAAGVVESVGAGVDGVSVGDEVVVLPSLWWGPRDDVQSPDCEVLGYPTQGTHAELLSVPAENVFPKPGRLSWDETAALPMAALTAWRAVVTRGRLAAGETLVVTAASSGVSSFAIQVGAALGARVVAVSSSDEKLEQARRLGAHAGVLRTSPDLAAELAAVASGADLVVDPAGADWPALVRALRPGGRLVALGRKAQDQAALPLQPLYWRQLDVLGSSMGSPRDFAALLEHVDGAAWAPVVDSVFPLDEIRSAYARLDHPDRFGKVVVAP